MEQRTANIAADRSQRAPNEVAAASLNEEIIDSVPPHAIIGVLHTQHTSRSARHSIKPNDAVRIVTNSITLIVCKSVARHSSASARPAGAHFNQAIRAG